jgi:acetolactate synthase-1/2/3 large subunit
MIPVDLQNAEAGAPARRRASFVSWPTDRPRPSQSLINRAAEALAEAEFPVVLAGGGIHASGATDALMRLQESASLPVITTIMGKGAVVETHPLSAGVFAGLTGPGSLGRHVRPMIKSADLFLLAGTRTNEDGTNKWTLIPPTAKLIHIDVAIMNQCA